MKNQGAILLISLIMIAIIAGIGLSFGSVATIHKKIVAAQATNINSKIKTMLLRNSIGSKIKLNITNPDNPCYGIANCTFLSKEKGALLTDLKKGLKEKSWWDQHANPYNMAAMLPDQNGVTSSYIIREIGTNNGNYIYEIISFSSDLNGKYQNVSRQYMTIVTPNSNSIPPAAATPMPN